MIKRLNHIQLLLNFAKDVATNYDCECPRANCRQCNAMQVISEVLGDKADSLVRGPYYGTSPEVLESLKKDGMPIDHLLEEPTP